MRYLLNVLETYRLDTVPEALAMREEMSNDENYDLVSFQCTAKYNRKTEEEYQVVKVKKIVNSEKEPDSGVKVHYDY